MTVHRRRKFIKKWVKMPDLHFELNEVFFRCGFHLHLLQIGAGIAGGGMAALRQRREGVEGNGPPEEFSEMKTESLARRIALLP